ncbi:hypothetical protein D3C85_999600 [compost metagenome]
MSYYRFDVTLIFGGEFCPMLPRKTFRVSAENADKAIQVAIHDAVAQGYKRGWVVEQQVEVL